MAKAGLEIINEQHHYEGPMQETCTQVVIVSMSTQQ